ncbi:MAG TPA: hypothetical protein VNW95_00415 [Mucilaginibacter sp.]|nr:hypothetical protein [Mucilaginibacter sp.]
MPFILISFFGAYPGSHNLTASFLKLNAQSRKHHCHGILLAQDVYD